MAYIKFEDESLSLIKSDCVWELDDENPLKLKMFLSSPDICLEKSLDLNLAVENNINTELCFEVDESSFVFKGSSDNNFGALILENKVQRQIVLAPLSKDTMVFSFMPIKSGFIELESVRFKERNLGREFEFQIHYKMLIN